MAQFRLTRHRLVERDIARIAAYLLEHTTPQSVTGTIAALESDADALGRNPYRGTRRDEISPGLRAIPCAGKAVIAFEVKEETRTVRILSITWGGIERLGRIAERAR